MSTCPMTMSRLVNQSNLATLGGNDRIRWSSSQDLLLHFGPTRTQHKACKYSFPMRQCAASPKSSLWKTRRAHDTKALKSSEYIKWLHWRVHLHPFMMAPKYQEKNPKPSEAEPWLSHHQEVSFQPQGAKDLLVIGAALVNMDTTWAIRPCLVGHRYRASPGLHPRSAMMSGRLGIFTCIGKHHMFRVRDQPAPRL